MPHFLDPHDPEQSFYELADKRRHQYEKSAHAIIETHLSMNWRLSKRSSIIRKRPMASNSFGTIFKITTWGESHGKAIGVVIDGCPAGLEIEESEINEALALRAPGRNLYTSPRKEADRWRSFQGFLKGRTTGAPISHFDPQSRVRFKQV